MLLKEYGKLKAKLLRAASLEPVHLADMTANGEQRLLRWLGRLPESANYDGVIDVGANVGDWTLAASEAMPREHITKYFCVEPIPVFATELRKRLSGLAGVQVFETVLSDEGAGEIEIFESGGGGRLYKSYRGNTSTASTDGENGVSRKTIVPYKVAKTTGDALLLSSDIKPYILKIDCDGHDLKVLQGLREFIEKRRPLIQFEYCDFWIGAGSRLKDACKLLGTLNYSTFRVFPERVAKFKFNPLFETFSYQNIFAAPNEFGPLKASTISIV